MQYNTVVITGGSSGIGLDLAKAYARQGANVVLLARNQDKLAQAVEQCRHCSTSASQAVLSFSVDVADKVALQECIGKVKDAVGIPDLLVLSAGVVQSVRFLEQSDEDFAAMVATNVFGSRAVAKGFLADMVARRSGQVCFVSSLAGLVPVYGYSGYSATKFALMGMAGALRQELHEHGIGVSVLCPPEVDTPMVAEESKHVLPQTRFLKDIGGTLDVTAVTKTALKGIAANRFVIIPGVMAKLTYLQVRLMPDVFRWVMQKLLVWSASGR